MSTAMPSKNTSIASSLISMMATGPLRASINSTRASAACAVWRAPSHARLASSLSEQTQMFRTSASLQWCCNLSGTRADGDFEATSASTQSDNADSSREYLAGRISWFSWSRRSQFTPALAWWTKTCARRKKSSRHSAQASAARSRSVPARCGAKSASHSGTARAERGDPASIGRLPGGLASSLKLTICGSPCLAPQQPPRPWPMVVCRPDTKN
mmetsp:Transcript_61086/g.162224  ORF Transcript_61086/g.162224 Transcript_61086/m.162224 type:complete len:214 (+) Transcript_61086:387-1028(+)